jgi:BlaI family transcriptional regulator, penicillinase repressor
MPRNIQDVTPAELAILQELWTRQEATVRELTERVYPEQTVSDFATVQKLLKRLEQKTCVIRREGTWPHIFVPILTREGLIERRLQKAANDLCNGDLRTLLAQFVQNPLVGEPEQNLPRIPVCENETHPPTSALC